MPRLLVTLLGLAACASPEDVDDPIDPVAVASAPGDYTVGYRQATVSWTPPRATEPREIPVEIWYPAEADAGKATYLVAGVIQKEAPLALDEPTPRAGRFPIAVYSHGSGGLGLLAWPYAERLASHGWIVVAPDHVGNTSFDLLSGDGESFAESLVHRPGDLVALLDDAASDDVLGLSASLDETPALLFGHSFGGYTSLVAGGAAFDVTTGFAACFADPPADTPDCALLADPGTADLLDGTALAGRIGGIVPQAPALIAAFADGALAGLDVPVLLQSAGRDITTPDEEEAGLLWPEIQGAHPESRWIRVPEGGHYSFISVCDDVGVERIALFQDGALEDGCGPDAPPTAEIVPAMATYLLAFGEVVVRGDDTFVPVLNATVHADVVVER